MTPPTLDAIAAARWQRIAPPTTPWLHEEVAQRMRERLQWIKLQPKTWLNWGRPAPAFLAKRYPKSSGFTFLTPVKEGEVALKNVAPHWWSRRPPPPPQGIDMLWANMVLHQSADPLALIARWHQALAVDGFVMFSCLGPDTCKELRQLYQAMGWPPSGHEFTDMHDWGDMLVQTGFAEPVMDMERITLTFETPARLLQELRELGRNFHSARFAALRGKHWRARLEQLLVEHLTQADGRLALTFELIYGHAIKPVPRVKLSEHSSISVQDMRAMLGQR